MLGEGGQHGDDPLRAAGHFDARAFSRSSDDGAHVVDLDGAGLALRLGSVLPVQVCAAVLLLDPVFNDTQDAYVGGGLWACCVPTDEDPLSLIHATSRGYPRAVNNLALQSLVAAFATGKNLVDEAAARASVSEVVGD
ncbi:hypothetical protein [Streptomyces mirabilis]|uniref:hypothetical protein n=1 Tax=Streptomyces mirabilis TaxID=68239 RepID=UPI003680DB95